MGKYNKYTDELRMEIVSKFYNNEGSSRSLGKEYNISYKTIDNWIQKHKRTNYNFKDNRITNSGRRKDENIDYKERYEILKKYQAFLKVQREENYILIIINFLTYVLF